MRIRAKSFGEKGAAVAAIAFLSVVLFPPSRASSQSGPYWTEDFEPPTYVVGSPLKAAVSVEDVSGWFSSDGALAGNPSIDNSIVFNGTQSLHGHYTGLDSGGFIDRYFGASTNEIWTRFYYRTTSFTYHDSGTKHFVLYDLALDRGGPAFWLMHLEGSREFGITALDNRPGSPLNNNINYRPNVASLPIADDRWYCIQTHYKMGTPGGSDGVVEIFVDGTPTVQYTDQNFLMPGDAFGFTGFRLYVQHGVGEMYYDLLSVGPVKIDCLGAPPSAAANPPSAPTN